MFMQLFGMSEWGDGENGLGGTPGGHGTNGGNAAAVTVVLEQVCVGACVCVYVYACGVCVCGRKREVRSMFMQ